MKQLEAFDSGAFFSHNARGREGKKRRALNPSAVPQEQLSHGALEAELAEERSRLEATAAVVLVWFVHCEGSVSAFGLCTPRLGFHIDGCLQWLYARVVGLRISAKGAYSGVTLRPGQFSFVSETFQFQTVLPVWCVCHHDMLSPKMHHPRPKPEIPNSETL